MFYQSKSRKLGRGEWYKGTAKQIYIAFKEVYDEKKYRKMIKKSPTRRPRPRAEHQMKEFEMCSSYIYLHLLSGFSISYRYLPAWWLGANVISLTSSRFRVTPHHQLSVLCFSCWSSKIWWVTWITSIQWLPVAYLNNHTSLCGLSVVCPTHWKHSPFEDFYCGWPQCKPHCKTQGCTSACTPRSKHGMCIGVCWACDMSHGDHISPF